MTAEFNTLVHQIYDCASTPSLWPEALESLAGTLKVPTVALQWCRIDSGRLQALRALTNASARERHQRYLHEISDAANPRLDASRLSSNAGRIVDDGDIIISHAEASRFRQALAHIGLGRFLGCAIEQNQGEYLAVALHKAPEDQTSFDTSQHQMLGDILQHIKRAARLSDTLSSNTHLHQNMADVIDRMRHGVVLCDHAGRISWMNKTAQRLLNHSPLHATNGTLHCATHSETMQLCNALSQPLTTYLRLGDGLRQRHLQLSIRVLSQSQDNGSDERRLVILADQACGIGQIPVEAISRLFLLTPAEACLTAALCQGMSIDEYATQRGVSVGTVRGQAKQVLAKTQTARQSDLVRLVLSSIAGQAGPCELQ